MFDLPPLHVVTDDRVCAREDFIRVAAQVLAAGGRDLAFHLRMPGGSGRRCYDLCRGLLEIAGAATVVVNDRVDVALAAGARAVQLGGRSLPLEDVRRMAPALAAGISVHGSEAPPDADWLMAGNVFETASHPGRPAAGTRLVELLAARGAHVVAIGGVTPQRVAALREAGARGVAVLSGVWNASEPAAAVQQYLQAWCHA